MEAVRRLVQMNNTVYSMVGTKISNQSNALTGMCPNAKIKMDKTAENQSPVLGVLKVSFSTLMKYPRLKSSSVIPPPITPKATKDRVTNRVPSYILDIP